MDCINNSIFSIVKNECTGCNLCEDICPVNAISFQYDEEGFLFPNVNQEKCVGCGKCKNTCPALYSKNDDTLFDRRVYAAWNKNHDIRWNSTSGGVFTCLAEYLLEENYYIVGAIYNDEIRVIHLVSNDKNDLCKMRQSKYVQSDLRGVYKEILRLLQNDEKVLFCGTPCQAAAVKKATKKYEKNIVIIDFICAGVGSPVVFESYIEYLEAKYKSKIKQVWFKNKDAGWDQLGTKVSFENGRQYFRIGSRDIYMCAFVQDKLNIRKSCFNCMYRDNNHFSDITLGDFWGIDELEYAVKDNLGVTAFIVNSKKGINIIENVKESLEWMEASFENVAKYNSTVRNSLCEGENRHDFLVDTQKEGIYSAYKKYGSYSGKNKLRRDIDYIKWKIKRYFNIKK